MVSILKIIGKLDCVHVSPIACAMDGDLSVAAFGLEFLFVLALGECRLSAGCVYDSLAPLRHTLQSHL